MSLTPEREAELRAELAIDGRTGEPVPEADIDASIRRIRDAEETEPGA